MFKRPTQLDIRPRSKKMLLNVVGDEKLANKIEVAAYNRTITHCKARGIHCVWSNYRFGNEYKAKMYQLLFNLKDNSKLRERVTSCTLQCRKLAGMTHYEMKPELWDPLLQRVMDRSFARDEAQMPDDYESLTACRYCKKHKVMWTLIQQRQADEGATEHFYCTNCKKRYKHT